MDSEKIRVLIADDHALLRDGIRVLLTINNDIEIVGEASNGKEAVEKTRVLQPHVVMMDVAMPVMEGLAATRHIAKSMSEVKVLILSQYDDSEHVTMALKAGASGYVPKRAVASELVSAVRTVYQGGSFLYPAAASAVIQDYRRRLKDSASGDLTQRETEVVKLVAEGHTSREVASMLSVSIKTVLAHRSKVMKRLAVHNRTELVKYAIRRGMIAVDT